MVFFKLEYFFYLNIDAYLHYRTRAQNLLSCLFGAAEGKDTLRAFKKTTLKDVFELDKLFKMSKENSLINRVMNMDDTDTWYEEDQIFLIPFGGT